MRFIFKKEVLTYYIISEGGDRGSLKCLSIIIGEGEGVGLMT